MTTNPDDSDKYIRKKTNDNLADVFGGRAKPKPGAGKPTPSFKAQTSDFVHKYKPALLKYADHLLSGARKKDPKLDSTDIGGMQEWAFKIKGMMADVEADRYPQAILEDGRPTELTVILRAVDKPCAYEADNALKGDLVKARKGLAELRARQQIEQMRQKS